MNRADMLNTLFKGNIKIKHELFSSEEYIIVKDGVIRDENGYNMGTHYSEFMEIRKGGNWEEGWSVIDDHSDFDKLGDGSEIINDYHNIYHDIPIDKPLKRGNYVEHKPRNLITRNDKCPCGSGKKYKHCCLNVL